ncbi:putative transcription factor interactor and regulator CCHC(Zn) family [Helianthus annuus]|uniref:Putative ARID DNA-binding domain-containing protein n=1 Tax=Helianthus annuus TaxID=4232 RepID=A0A251RLI1_HELAN|nr:putative transcription factor interactor and regulator CCHC(Zn) family [Helianthus annuus]KAJ0427783.1 putative transcription factor interactor and regulator CCHC(Zn) family [Helianthus annuus]KAJ0431649.1 putative transcription factor interactor and regulator CCHC(Zn) family [Helianthus annuus]KAJ0446072.1 putative transcription factor interactor and regulator ARID family [Helianthus annuus]
MPAYQGMFSAASSNTYADNGDESAVQHSGIRAMSRSDAEIKPTATMMPCQHCSDEKNERKRRSRRERLCYYCHLPGHQIYTCKAKENDEELQLIRQAINAGIRTQNEDVHCHDEMIVTGTDGGEWKDIWYVNSTFHHHYVGNIDVFKRVKHIMGVETKSGMNNFLFIRGVGIVEMKTGNDTLRIPSVFYSPDIDRNVLSLEQLTLQGFTVRKSGDSCKIFPMFSSPVVNSVNDTTGLSKEQELGLKEKERLHNMSGIDDEFKSDYLNSYFESLNVSEKEGEDWNLMILNSLEFHNFDDCKALMDMLDDREYVFKYKVILQKKFEDLVRWFLYDYMGITSRPIPPFTTDQKKIDLLSLYILVANDGGYREVTTENTWPIIAKDLGLGYEEGDHIRIVYAMYLDVLEYYYKFKTVQNKVQVKEMINEDAGMRKNCDRKSRSADMVQGSAAGINQHDEGSSQESHRKIRSAGNTHEGAEMNNQSMHYALFAEDGWADNWSARKRRKRFNFTHIRKAMEEANRSVMQKGSNITKV